MFLPVKVPYAATRWKSLWDWWYSLQQCLWIKQNSLYFGNNWYQDSQQWRLQAKWADRRIFIHLFVAIIFSAAWLSHTGRLLVVKTEGRSKYTTQIHHTLPFKKIWKPTQSSSKWTLQWRQVLKVLRHGFVHLEKSSLNFSSSSFAIRVSLLHPWPPLILYCFLWFFWCFSIIVYYHFQASFNFKVIGQGNLKYRVRTP